MRFIATNNLRGLEYKGIFAGKMRRYFSFQNFLDVFKVGIGFWQAVFIVRKFDPNVVFSKGGFVALPVVMACAWINFWRRVLRMVSQSGQAHIAIVIHESDVVPGLSNRIAARFADKILVSFEKTRNAFRGHWLGAGRGHKVEVVGNPVRSFLFKGEIGRGLKLCGFNIFKPVVLVMGGSQGAHQINNLVWGNLDELLKKWQIVHIAGKGNVQFGLKKIGYKQFDLLFDELKDVYATCDVVVSRGGANSLSEIAALGKKAVIIPLGLAGSRGDQIVNARVCAEEYGWQVLYDKITNEQFLRAIELASEEKFKGDGLNHKKSSGKIVDLIAEI